MEAKFAIVGGGVMGVSIAWHAAVRADPLDAPVVLVEKSVLAAGSSGRSGAILRQFYSQREVAAMARDSLSVYAGFERRTGRKIGFQKMGVLTIAGPAQPDDIALIERNVEMMRGIGIDVRRLEAAEITRLVPAIAVRDGSVAAYEPDGAAVDPVATVEAIASLAREKGAVTRLGCGALSLLRRGDRVVGIETTEGPLEAETVVVAAGPWTKKLLLGAGVDLPFRAVRPEQLFLEVLPGQASHPVLLDLENGFYARCETHPSRQGLASPRTRIGGMDVSRDEEVGDPDDLLEEVGTGFRAWARSRIELRMPGYRTSAEVGAIAGMYTLTPDSQAVIGPIPDVPGLLVVSGFSGHGFKLAPSVGEGVAQMLWNEPVSAFDVEFFSPGRFHEHRDGARGRGFGL